MSAITKNISLNIYEPENNLKYLKDTKKKSIITKIIKNPEIIPQKKLIKEKLINIKQKSNQLNVYNIFRRPGDATFNPIKNEDHYEQDNNAIINRKKKNKINKNHKSENFLIYRKQIEKLNKKIPNNLYDYLHPYEYQYNLKKNNLLKHFLEIQINNKLPKKKIMKTLKLSHDNTNKNPNNSKYKCTNLFLPSRNHLKSASNKKASFVSKSLKAYNTMNNENFPKAKNINKRDEITRLKTSRPKKDNNIYENNYTEDSSSLSFTEKINNNEKYFGTSNSKKRLIINGNEISSFKNLLNFNTICSDNLNSNNDSSIQGSKNRLPYNQKIFSRNNNILTPFEEMKKLVFHSDYEISNPKRNYNFFQYSGDINSKENIDIRNKRNRNTKLSKQMTELTNDLNELKFYIISDKIDREKLTDKIIELQKKMNYSEDKVMIIKDILFEKLNNSDNQNDFISHAVNKNQYVSNLISSYGNTNEKKCEGLLDKKFFGGLKKLNSFGMKDAMIRNVIGENNYFIKHRINKIEEVRLSKNRKHLGDNSKKIKQLVKIISNRKRNISEGNNNN